MTIADTAGLELDDSFARELPELRVEWKPSAVPAPTLIALNRELARELRLAPEYLESPEGLAVLAGNATPEKATPVAMAYAGHQFGGYSPSLGDGRALLLGEVVDPDGRRRDIHLKGSGRTPFARGGDGKAAVGPMLREFVMAEAMHALKISTARALSVVTTGEHIHREGPVSGAVLTRVAASHIRVGTFEYAARLNEDSLMTRLVDYSIGRHHPNAATAGDGRYLTFLEAVVDAQAALIADWMLVGFIHGVMNTDNMAISGETIDYGPCAFMDRYDPATVYSSIDHMGRYSYGNQPAIAQWNLARLAETLLPWIDPDRDAAIATATELLTSLPQRYEGLWLNGMRSKLGLVEAQPTDGALVEGLLDLLHAQRVDYTSSFRALASSLRGDDRQLMELFQPRVGIEEWSRSWLSRLEAESRDVELVAREMDRRNPIYIPRNHLVDEALEAAAAGDIGTFDTLLEVVTSPFDARADRQMFAGPAPESFDSTFQTFCGT